MDQQGTKWAAAGKELWDQLDGVLAGLLRGVQQAIGAAGRRRGRGPHSHAAVVHVQGVQSGLQLRGRAAMGLRRWPWALAAVRQSVGAAAGTAACG